MANDRFEDARPTVVIDGREDDKARQALLALTIDENTEGLFRCEATVGNLEAGAQSSDFRYFDRKTFDFGKRLQIKFQDELLFDGRIMALEARFSPATPPALVVLAEDALQDLRMTRRTRTFENKSDADVFNKIADDHGMDKNVKLTGNPYKVLAQVNQSDLAFLRTRARAIEAELWISMSQSGKPTLNVQKRSDRKKTPVKLGFGNELSEFGVIADLAGQRTAVIASGWDVSAKDKVSYSATDNDLGGELGNDESGASILKSRFGERKEAVAHGVPLTQGEAEDRAKAHFQMQARRFVVGHGVARTTGKLRVGAVVDLDGLGPLFSGKYYLAEVRHCFDGAQGLRTEFCAERAGLGRP